MKMNPSRSSFRDTASAMFRIDEQTYRMNFQCVSMEYELAAWLQNFQTDYYFSGEFECLKIRLERQGVLLGTDGVRKQNGSCHDDTMQFPNASLQAFPDDDSVKTDSWCLSLTL